MPDSRAVVALTAVHDVIRRAKFLPEIKTVFNDFEIAEDPGCYMISAEEDVAYRQLNLLDNPTQAQIEMKYFIILTREMLEDPARPQESMINLGTAIRAELEKASGSQEFLSFAGGFHAWYKQLRPLFTETEGLALLELTLQMAGYE